MSRRTNAHPASAAAERSQPAPEFSIVPAPDATIPPPATPTGPQADLVAWGDVRVAEGAHLRGTLMTQGRLEVGARAVVEGAVTAGTGATIGEAARIVGALDVTGETTWAPQASVDSATLRGPLVMGGLVRARAVISPAGIHPRARREAS